LHGSGGDEIGGHLPRLLKSAWYWVCQRPALAYPIPSTLESALSAPSRGGRGRRGWRFRSRRLACWRRYASRGRDGCGATDEGRGVRSCSATAAVDVQFHVEGDRVNAATAGRDGRLDGTPHMRVPVVADGGGEERAGASCHTCRQWQPTLWLQCGPLWGRADDGCTVRAPGRMETDRLRRVISHSCSCLLYCCAPFLSDPVTIKKGDQQCETVSQPSIQPDKVHHRALNG